jgi:hypothetical protein
VQPARNRQAGSFRIFSFLLVAGMRKNPEWKRAYASVISAVIFGLICFGAFGFMNGMAGGYAVAFVAFFLMASGIAVAGLFFHRALVMDAIITSHQLLAHWTYPDEIARQSALREYAEYQKRNHALFILVGGMLGAVAIFFIIFIEEGGLETGVFLIAVAILIFIVSRIAPKIQLKHALAAPHEAFIAYNGIIYEGAVYPFRSFMMTMNGVSLKKARGKDPTMLTFSFTQLVGAYIIQPFDIAVPVPAGEEDTAEGVIRVLGGSRS